MMNLAGRPKEEVDAQVTAELQAAGIPLFPFRILQQGEVKTDVFGMTGLKETGHEGQPVWVFRRAWYYWIATFQLPGPFRFTMAKAKALHATHGKDVRVDGHCGCPDPEEWWGKEGIPYNYHIDTQEGLNAFAKAIME